MGTKLTPEQEDFMKNNMLTDENGALISQYFDEESGTFKAYTAPSPRLAPAPSKNKQTISPFQMEFLDKAMIVDSHGRVIPQFYDATSATFQPYYGTNNGGGGPKGTVSSVNGMTGAITGIATKSEVDAVKSDIAQIEMHVKSFGAVGNGSLRRLSEDFSTLAQAQTKYPKATSLDQSVDWAAIQTAVDFCGEKEFNLNMSGGTYIITDTIRIYKESSGRHEFRINFNRSQIKTSLPIVMVEVENKTGQAYAKGWSVYLDNLNLDGQKVATAGLFINRAQGVHINSLYVDQCLTGLQVRNIYYGAYDGLNIINNCITGIALTGEENNAVDYSKFWIIGGSRIDEVNSVGVDIQTRCLNLTLSDLTIESYGTAIKQSVGTYGTLHVDIKNCYFELIKQSFIDISGDGLGEGSICTIKNCHGHETSSVLAKNAIRVGNGYFEITNNNFKDNVVEMTAVNTSVKTNMTCFAFQGGSASGWQQSIQKVNGRKTVNSLKDLQLNNEIVIRDEASNNLKKVYPVSTKMNRDTIYSNSAGVILTSKNGTLRRLVVDDAGVLSTVPITPQSNSYVSPDYNAFMMSELLTMDLTKYPYNSLRIQDTNNLYNIVGGVESYSGANALGLRASGSIEYIISALTTIIVTPTWNSLFIYNTAIKKTYVLQGSYWGWAGEVPWRDFTEKRAVGSTAQRPVLVSSDTDFIYYDTDINGYFKWSGTAWTSYTP